MTHTTPHNTIPLSSRAATRPRSPHDPADRDRVAIRLSAGFTLMEVLVAIGIFTVGMVAVASIFPVAILLQRETVYSVEAKNFGRSAEKLVDTIGFQTAVASPAAGSWADVENNGAGIVSPLPADAFNAWSILDRAYNTSADAASRTVFWVPLVYDSNNAAGATAWRIYLFVVRGRDDETYAKPGPAANWANAGDNSTNPGIPGVLKIDATVTAPDKFLFANNPRLILPGDDVVDENGTVYSVVAPTGGFDPNTGIQVAGTANNIDADGDGFVSLWAAHPGTGTVSTFVKLITLIDDGSGNHLIREP